MRKRIKEIKLNSDISITQLREITSWVTSVEDLDQLLELIIETATHMMNAKASSLLLVDQKTKRLYFKVATGDKKDDVKKFEIAPSVARNGKKKFNYEITPEGKKALKSIYETHQSLWSTIVIMALDEN